MLIENITSNYRGLGKNWLFDGHHLIFQSDQEERELDRYNHMMLSHNCKMFCINTRIDALVNQHFYFLQFLDLHLNLGIVSDFVFRLTRYQIIDNSTLLEFLLIDFESFYQVGQILIYHCTIVLKDDKIHNQMDFYVFTHEQEIFTYSFGEFDQDYFFISCFEKQKKLCFLKKHRMENSHISFNYQSVNKTVDAKNYQKQLEILKAENYNPHIRLIVQNIDNE
jgi:hypothetical protein